MTPREHYKEWQSVYWCSLINGLGWTFIWIAGMRMVGPLWFAVVGYLLCVLAGYSYCKYKSIHDSYFYDQNWQEIPIWFWEELGVEE